MRNAFLKMGVLVALVASCLAISTVPAQATTFYGDNVEVFYEYDFKPTYIMGGTLLQTKKWQPDYDCDTVGYQWEIPFPSRVMVSSMKVYMPSLKHCNWAQTHQYGSTNWYGQCVKWGGGNVYNWGFNFPYRPGAFMNDNVDFVAIKYNPACTLWV